MLNLIGPIARGGEMTQPSKVGPRRILSALQGRGARVATKLHLTLLSTFYVARQRLSRNTDAKARLGNKAKWTIGLLNERDWHESYHSSEPEAAQFQAEAQNPECPIRDPMITEYLSTASRTDIAIIDVGAGAITQVGYTYPGKNISVTPVDPLADHYAKVLRKRGVKLPFPTVKGDGETLLSQFSRASFDIAYARNSLDHTYDPIATIANMLELVRDDGVVLLRHYRDEAEGGEYEGLHQWNFDCKDDRFVIWNKDTHVLVDKVLGPNAKVSCSVHLARKGEWRDEILVMITKAA